MDKKDSLDGKDFEELLKLKDEIEEKIKFFNENASPEAIEKLKKHKDKTNLSDNFENDFSSMDKKQKHKTIRKLNFLNKSLNVYNSFIKAIQSNIDIDPGRLMGLTEGIFSIVMTLLVFNIKLPEMALLTSNDYLAFIQSMVPNIGVTLVSFIILASFWVYHHQFLKVKSLNMPFLWLNIIFLACISFIPFTTSMVGAYSDFFLDNVLFGLNVLLSLVLFIIMFKYVDKMNFLENDLTDVEKRFTFHTFYMLMGITVIVILLDFYVSQDFFYLFLLIPIVSIIRDTVFKLKHAQ